MAIQTRLKNNPKHYKQEATTKQAELEDTNIATQTRQARQERNPRQTMREETATQPKREETFMENKSGTKIEL